VYGHVAIGTGDCMQIDIRATNIELPPAAFRAWKRRVLFALNRFAPRVRAVRIVLCDINGPRGGKDAACLVRVTGADGWTVTVSDVNFDPGRALAHAVGRAGRAVARQVERLRDARAPRRGRGAA